jgi:hypothetical protein
MNNIVQMRRKSYEAEAFRVFASGLEFRMSGTLDGGIDFCIIESSGDHRTYNIDCDEARVLADKLNAAASDVQKNCLFDSDPLLVDAQP